MPLRYFIFGFLFFVYSCASSQKPISADSLEKYSYSFFTSKKKIPEVHFGTGFFLRQGSRLYFVTARHTFIQCDSTNKKEYYNGDYATIDLPTQSQTIPIELVKTKDSCNCLDLNRYPDIAVFELGDSAAYKVNSAEEFMLPPFKSFSDAEMYGQGFVTESTGFYFTKQHHTHLPSKTFEILAFLGDSVTRRIDSVDYFFFVTTLKFGPSYKGYSGSPVFLQDSSSKKWRIAGIFTSGMEMRIDGKWKETLCITRQEFITGIIGAGRLNLKRDDCR